MKKYILITLTLGTLPIFSQAQQLPNASFETWSGTGNNEKPDNWNQLNASLPSSVAAFVPKTCHKTTPGYTGTYCVKLETVNVTFQGATNGVLTTGDLITSPPYGVEGGIIYPYRPDSLVGWYKVAPVGADLGTIEIALLDANQDTVGHGKFFTPNATINTWTRFSTVVNYWNTSTPDKAIAFASSSNGFNPVVGSLLWIDDLSLVFNPLSITETKENTASVYAYNNILYVNTLNSISDNLNVGIYSIDGKLIFSENLKNNTINSIPLNLSSGIYIYSFLQNNKITTGKVSVR